MTRQTRRRIGLLAIVAVLALASVWQWQRQHAGQTGTLLALAPAQVTRISIQRPGQQTHRYRRQDGRWQAADSARPADAQQMAALAALAATPVLQWRPATDYDPARIGLAPPPVVVSLNGQRLAYGSLTAFGPQRFVRVGDRIAVIPASHSPPSVPREPGR